MEELGTIHVYDHTAAMKIFHPLLALIASATDCQLARYVEFLKEENRLLRACLPKEVHTKPGERHRLLALGKSLGLAIEELITIVNSATFYCWCRDENDPRARNSKGGQRKPREIRELVQFATSVVASHLDTGNTSVCTPRVFSGLTAGCRPADQSI